MPAVISDTPLEAAELEALLEVLTHHATFAEIQDMKYENLVENFGPPLTSFNESKPTAFPLFQGITEKFVPRDALTEEAWTSLAGLWQRLAAINLSDSYDKGIMGLRKSGATAASASVESIVRGALTGAPKRGLSSEKRTYDRKDAQHLEQAWDDAVEEMVYGDLLSRVVESIKTSPNIEDIPPVASAALDLLIIQAATFYHHLIVVLPDGQALLHMMDMMHTLTPYTVIKTTVRMGNVASMLNGMTKILLTKVNGKNLLQTVMSRSMSWDMPIFEKRMKKVQKNKSCPDAQVLRLLEQHVNSESREQQETYRRWSRDRDCSIVAMVLEGNQYTGASLTTEEHELALEYLSCLLAIRDRKEGIEAMCKASPDLLTVMTQEIMKLVTPLLQVLHDGKFDMGQVVKLQQRWNEDILKTAKVKKDHTPSIEDFVALIHRQLPALWKILHEGAVKCPSLPHDIEAWCQSCLVQFRRADGSAAVETKIGTLTGPLMDMFERLPPAEKRQVRDALQIYAQYMTNLKASSTLRMQQILDKSTASFQGPGAVVPRWHALLDSTYITPATFKGPVRTGRDVKFGRVKAEKKKSFFSREKDSDETVEPAVDMTTAQTVLDNIPQAPDMSVVIDTLYGSFQEHISQKGFAAHSGGSFFI